jgi:hypothetical protein
MKLDTTRLAQLIEELFRITDELTTMTGRAFTPDGHLVGSIGEVLAASAYGLDLEPHSATGCDAIKDGRRIEIKATFGKRVGFRAHDACDEADHVLVLKLQRAAPFDFEEVYNGPAKPVLEKLAPRPLPSNGQRPISLATLRVLNLQVSAADRLARVGTQEFA